MKQTFEKYLQDVFAKQYVGTDDDMVDAESDWLQNLSVEDWISYAEKWAEGNVPSVEDAKKLANKILATHIHKIIMEDELKGNEEDCICAKPKGKHEDFCDAYRLSKFFKKFASSKTERMKDDE
jgi:hypothetical protein